MIADGYIPLRELVLRWLAARLPVDLVWYCSLRLLEHAAKHHPLASVTLSDALIYWYTDKIKGHLEEQAWTRTF